eukprot:gene11341-23732_t
MEAFNTIGFFTPDTQVFKDCDIWTDISCAKPVFNTRDGLIVDDSPNVVEVQMPQIIRTALSVAAVVALTVVCWFLFIVVLYMDDRIIKSAQPNMLLMMLFGGFLGSVRIILATLDLTDTLCMVGKWVGHLAFVFVFGAMRPHRAYKESFDGHNTVRLIKCTNIEKTTTSVLFAMEGLTLAYGAHLCWSTKEVPGAVNDSSYISLALFLILFVCALTFPIVFLSITPTPVILMTIMAT